MARHKKNNNEETPNMPISSTPIQEVVSQPNVEQDTQVNVLFFIENSGIGRTQVNLVKKQISEAKNSDLLYLVLNTIGGDVYSTVRIVRLLQSKFSKIIVLVPEFAYSSGTVMCLGCDEIHMAVEATLGPLDLPMEHPVDGCSISSLDVTQTMTNLASICNVIGMKTFNELRSNENTEMRLGKKEAAEIAFKTASNIIVPIVEKIDPFNLQKGFREQKVGLYYAIDMLVSKTMAKNYRQAVDTSMALVNNFPSHSYGIFRDEARNTLRLKVLNLEDNLVWEKIEPIYTKITSSYTSRVEFQLI